ncbi:MAG TPA: Uma2 family endonuclease [Thermoanaerobaculia bacterium]|jgi:Uma2 family endonuclease|nr:Uma2 family endonuclease [Thermoanaerobaculia bacterium]
MSQSAAQALDDLSFDLVYSDGWPLDSNWERIQINLLIDVARQAMAAHGRPDFFAGGDMFVYHSIEQARDVARGRPYLRGPDFFFVGGVEDHDRKSWVSWQEGGRLPDVIAEFLSPSTKEVDRTTKKDLYARIFRTPEYFLYEPATGELEGFSLVGGRYQRLFPDAENRIWSAKLGLKLGLWHGLRTAVETTWVRLFDADGRLVPTKNEAAEARAEAEHQRAETERQRAETADARAEAADARAEAERQRAEAAEAELARLRAKLEGTAG